MYRLRHRILFCNLKRTIVLAMIIILVLSTATILTHYYLTGNSKEAKQFYVGVSFCGNTTTEAKLLIDRIKDYTNLFVLQSGPISENETATNEICDYAFDAGLNMIVFFGDLTPRLLNEKDLSWRLFWLNTTRFNWGDRVLGIYYYDEPGGIQIDYNWTEQELIWNPTDNELTYDSMARMYNLGFRIFDQGFRTAKESQIDLFVSDYALYWFDYLAGYDVVLAQAGWNHSLSQDIALARGAARMQNKSWGIIITWKYDNPPYLDDADSTFEQMVTAYETGAEYVVIFNYPTLEDNEYGVMKSEHFNALERFWNEVVQNPEAVPGKIEANVALVLPRNYGWGMRHPNDRIWGWWGPDEKSPQIWAISRQLLAHYGLKLDIIYEDTAYPAKEIYPKIFYWNQTANFD